MKRFALGAAVGGLAAYLFDPVTGADRRERLTSLWRENRDSAMQAGQAASQAIESARPLARRVSKAVGRGDWAQAFDRRRPAASLPKLLGAAAVGGALVYFLDPVRGSERRRSTLEAGRKAVTQLARAVKTVPGRVSPPFGQTDGGVKSPDSRTSAQRTS
jgi:gas vesicle protein